MLFGRGVAVAFGKVGGGDVELLGEASGEVLRVVEADLVGDFGDVHILSRAVDYHFLRDVETVRPDELGDGLSESHLYLFVQHTAAHTHSFSQGIDVEVGILVLFLDGAQEPCGEVGFFVGQRS